MIVYHVGVHKEFAKGFGWTVEGLVRSGKNDLACMSTYAENLQLKGQYSLRTIFNLRKRRRKKEGTC